jgi:hypothetical protein
MSPLLRDNSMKKTNETMSMTASILTILFFQNIVFDF